ncbi:MAG: type II toxin-antitoxin system HicB family antitoxin [Oscillospiraceae bacterium]|nr:type II toxin-antitoxin system HicB family antitoxin [Oscillospiraceae bacterium]
MKYVYPAVFAPEDGKMLVSVPDLKGCHTFGEDLAEAIEMAIDAAETWLWDAENKNEPIPPVSVPEQAFQKADYPNSFVNFILLDTDEYRRKHDSRSVNKTLTIPAWLDYQAKQANAPFSQILQQGLKEYLKIS